MLNNKNFTAAKRLINTSKKITKSDLPNYSNGNSGDLAIHTTSKGPALFGKVGNKWYRFGAGSEVGHKGRVKKKSAQEEKQNIYSLNVLKDLKIGLTKFSLIPTKASGDDYLQINSRAFDIETSTTTSKLHIGDIEIQPSWGSSGGIIQVVGADNNSGNHLTISGGDSSGGNNNGGNVYIDAGLKAGSGTSGTISIGHNGSNVRSSATNLYSSGDIALSADGGNVTMSDGTTTIFDFDVDGVNLKIMDDANTSDYFNISVGANGATTISTTDNDGGNGILTLSPNGNLILSPSTGGIRFHDSDNGDDYVDFEVDANGALHIETVDNAGSDANISLDADGDITLDAAGDQINIDNAGTTFGTIDTSVPTKLQIIGTTDYQVFITSQGEGDISLNSGDNITLDATDALVFDSDGVYIMKKDGTEFSAANSAYAGMILGYTDIGLNESHANYNLTTSYVVPTDEHSVTFTAPPSGNVEIWCQLGQFYLGSSGAGNLYAGLSTANATDGYSALSAIHEEGINDANARYGFFTPRNSWTLTGLTAGTSYTYWVGVKSTSTSGTPKLYWGGNTTGRYPDFIMKAIALPATIAT